jgi:hypothetical protein
MPDGLLSGEYTALAVTSMVLVVAPDPGFRRSIEFALEAEGYGVDSRARLSDGTTSPAASLVCCAVIDEDGTEDGADAWKFLWHFPKPIVLLVDKPWSLPEPDGMKVLVKPLLGNALVEAVRHVVARSMAAN